MEDDYIFIREIMAQICDYAVENGMNPSNTLYTVGEYIMQIGRTTMYDGWKRRRSECSDKMEIESLIVNFRLTAIIREKEQKHVEALMYRAWADALERYRRATK